MKETSTPSPLAGSEAGSEAGADLKQSRSRPGGTAKGAGGLERLRAQRRRNSRRWYRNHKEQFKAIARDWKLRNPDATRRHCKNNYHRHRERRLEYQKEWYRQNRSRIRKQQNEARWKNPVKSMISAAKNRANKNGLIFRLLESDISIPKFCPALGIRLVQNRMAATDSSPSLDRIRPELGYVAGNVRVISHLANRIKSNGTAKQLRLIADYIERESSWKQSLNPN